MSFKIEIDGDKRSRLVVCCDLCGSRIDRFDSGVALWLESKRQIGRTFEVFHCHKGDCDVLFERDNPPEKDQCWMSHELKKHFSSLWM